jgi:hypothetical protein
MNVAEMNLRFIAPLLQIHHAKPKQALLIGLSRKGARYREWNLFVRIWKGLRNITEQNLLCISDVVRTGMVGYL